MSADPILLLASRHGRGHARRLAVLAEALLRRGVRVCSTEAVLGSVPPQLAALARRAPEPPAPDLGREIWRARAEGRLREGLRTLEEAEKSALPAWRAYLRGLGPLRAVVSDADGFPLAAAGRDGMPGVLVSNFTWGDLVAHWGEEASWLDALLAGATALRLPFELGLRGVPRTSIEAVPNLAWPAAPGDLAEGEETGPVVALLALGFGDAAVPDRLDAREPTLLLAPRGARLPPALDPRIRVASVDEDPRVLMGRAHVVVTKGSYATVSEAVALRRPMHLLLRPDSPEDARMEAVLAGAGVARAEGAGRGAAATLPGRSEARAMADRYRAAGDWAACDPDEVAASLLALL